MEFIKYCIIILSCIVLICSIVLVTMKHSQESFGSYITPTQVEGAVRVGSTALSGAVEFAQPNEECFSRCAAAVEGSTFMLETDKDLRLQECRAQCGYFL